MTDLRKGIISFEEMEITPKTTKQEFLKGFEGKISPTSGKNIVYLNKASEIDGQIFAATFYFENEKFLFIELYPYIQYKSEKWDRTGQQEERRQFCDKWLYERLGEPHKIINGDIEYTFDNIRISCFSNFDIHHGANAGYIVVRYLD